MSRPPVIRPIQVAQPGRFRESMDAFAASLSRPIESLGSMALFFGRTLFWLFNKGYQRDTLLLACYNIGVLSLPVIMLTGVFIGMVLAVQSYEQFKLVGIETRLGAMINMSLVRELGPVLAATMLAGRIGSSIAAELGTMRVTEQIDALSSMGANPIHYLVVPRFLACLFLIPVLTIMADFMGVLGGAFYGITILNIDPHYYWTYSENFVGLFDLFIGVFKSFFFGMVIAIISCYQGFHCAPGAEGVGKAATVSFVMAFVVILFLDLLLGIVMESVYLSFWPSPRMV